jgi:predicted nucleic acid-binding protein
MGALLACTAGCLRLRALQDRRVDRVWRTYLIASTAAANGLPVYTRNPSDFDALKAIIKVVRV